MSCRLSAFIVALCLSSTVLVVCWATTQAQPPKAAVQPVQFTPVFKASLIFPIHGSDGKLSVSREVVLPFVPERGMAIDMHAVERVAWSTNQNLFIVTLDTLIITDTPAREALRTITVPGAVWKDLMWLPKR